MDRLADRTKQFCMYSKMGQRYYNIYFPPPVVYTHNIYSCKKILVHLPQLTKVFQFFQSGYPTDCLYVC